MGIKNFITFFGGFILPLAAAYLIKDFVVFNGTIDLLNSLGILLVLFAGFLLGKFIEVRKNMGF